MATVSRTSTAATTGKAEPGRLRRVVSGVMLVKRYTPPKTESNCPPRPPELPVSFAATPSRTRRGVCTRGSTGSHDAQPLDRARAAMRDAVHGGARRLDRQRRIAVDPA